MRMHPASPGSAIFSPIWVELHIRMVKVDIWRIFGYWIFDIWIWILDIWIWIFDYIPLSARIQQTLNRWNLKYIYIYIYCINIYVMQASTNLIKLMLILLQVIGFLLYLIDGDQFNISKLKQLNLSKIDAIFKVYWIWVELHFYASCCCFGTSVLSNFTKISRSSISVILIIYINYQRWINKINQAVYRYD